MNDPVPYVTLVIGSIAGLNLFALWRLIRRRQLVSAVGGLHVNVFFYIVVGPAAYLFVDQPNERVPCHEVVLYFGVVGPPLLVGYAVWALLESFLVRTDSKLSFRDLSGRVPKLLVLAIGFASLVGYYVAQSEFATSGVGIIFVVLKNLLYPSLVIALLQTRWNDPVGVMIAVGAVCVCVVLGAMSAWRSDLVLTGVCVLLYLVLAAPRWVAPAVVAAAVGLWVLMPTLQVKKTRYEEFQAAPVDTVIRSQDLSAGERTELLFDFMAKRVNSLREAAYVQQAIDKNLTVSRGGGSYGDAFLQLIPRAVWPDKPSFNTSMNYLLAREIGLVAWEDQNTSWGVNAFAECILNFHSGALVWFVPALFAFFHLIDRLSRGLYASISVRGYAAMLLFFQTFGMVGLVNLGTYVLWGQIVLLMVDYCIGRARPRGAEA